jgi:hypothetical protein
MFRYALDLYKGDPRFDVSESSLTIIRVISPLNRVLFEKLIVAHLVKDAHHYGNCTCTTVFTSSSHWILS